MEEWQEQLREQMEKLHACCHAHPKEAVETALLVVLLLFAGVWFLSSGDEEAMTVAPQDTASAPKPEKASAGTRVAVKGAELAAENGELTNPFSFEHETKQQMAAHPSVKKKTNDAAKTAQANGGALVASSAVAPSSPSGAAGDVPTQEAAEPPLVLKGVGISETDAVAVVIAYGTRSFVRVGDEVAGMTVTAMDRDSVTLAGDGGTTVLWMATP